MTDSKQRIAVVGVDFERCGDEAILMALRMMSEGSLQAAHLLHVLDPRDVIDDPAVPALQTEELVVERAPSLLQDRALRIASSFGLTFDASALHAHARIGGATETLLQMTVDYDADLLIVGSHRRRGIDRLVLGSVAEALVRRAQCAVLIAREKNYAGAKKTPLPDAPYAPGQAPYHSKDELEPSHHISSTEADGWHSSDSGPTGFRIV